MPAPAVDDVGVPPTPTIPLPRYGEAALADLAPALLSAVGVAGCRDSLGIDPVRAVCLLLVDGLGWELLRRHADEAAFLGGLLAGGAALTAGFPATTATSLASLGTGVPPGEHGFVGYLLRLPGHDRPVNLLRWAPAGPGPAADLLDALPPERFQPRRTVFERAADAGLAVSVVAPRDQARSGLTRAVLRGGRFTAALAAGDLAAHVLDALRRPTPSFVYAYVGELDLVGHVRGPSSPAWRLQLAHLDRLVALVAERLPRGTALVVTGDHGMVEVAEEHRVDVDRVPALRAGVRMLGGEPRARHVYAEPGAAADVLATWRELLGDCMWVLPRDEAVGAGWFGPVVAEPVRTRIGDVVAAAYGDVGVVQPSVEPLLSAFPGQHGSFTAAEQLVPLLTVRG